MGQAALRDAAAAFRFAMNAARRVPRAHGITVSSLVAVAMTPLMKRALVFMGSILCLAMYGAIALA